MADALAAAGANVVVTSRHEAEAVAVAGEICAAHGRRGFGMKADVVDPTAVASVVERADGELGGVDVLVNNAGITADGLLARMSLEQWQSVLDTNLTGSFAVTRELVRGMMRRRWGRIVTVSSVVGLMGNAGQANYAAAKAGLIGFTKSVARELASRNITANVVAPGFVETAMTDVLPEETKRSMFDDIPLGRFGRAEEIAAAVVYLASEEAGYVTGQVLNVSGGLYI
jgi:3-oxoacyl-[acyl-carrier protein] reductase